ncbi:hypothetical protein [Nocardia amamiensis]|uniref:hypothetical protein n=1 Tax=Nocardia TaxID=1817 RepID=UPI0033E004A7
MRTPRDWGIAAHLIHTEGCKYAADAGLPVTSSRAARPRNNGSTASSDRADSPPEESVGGWA